MNKEYEYVNNSNSEIWNQEEFKWGGHVEKLKHKRMESTNSPCNINVIPKDAGVTKECWGFSFTSAVLFVCKETRQKEGELNKMAVTWVRDMFFKQRSHQGAGTPQLDIVHSSSSHTVSLTSRVRRWRCNLNILQWNVSLTLLTYVVVTTRGTSLLLDNH